LNDSGYVAINGGLNSASSYDEGIWFGTPKNLTLAVRTDDPAPGVSAGTFFQFWGGALVNAQGELALNATCKIGGALTSCNGIWAGPAGNLGLLAFAGDPAPGTAGLTYSALNLALADSNDLGVTTFIAGLESADGYSYGSGTWRGNSSALDLLAATGDPAPDTAGLFFTEIDSAITNRWGEAVIAAATDDPAASFPGGYWKITDNGMSAIAQAGDVAPGTGGRIFGNLRAGNAVAGGAGYSDAPSVATVDGAILAQTGNVAFNGYLDPVDPYTGAGDEGIWVHDDAGLSLVALVGDFAPGTAGLQYSDFNHLNYNAQGQFAFDAALNSTDPATDHGIWRGYPGALNLVAREGDPAPGVAGETFEYLTYGPSMNDAGDLVFHARLAESGTEGVWVATSDGVVNLVLREGETLKVKDGDYRTIKTLGVVEGTPSSYVAQNGFNEAGQLAIAIEFTDGTAGIFLASPVSIATNQSPVADAGPDRTVIENKTITIDGGASFDPENTVLTFVWSLDGVEVATGPQYTAGPFGVGTHTVTLTVTDREGASASDDMILTVDPNLPPVANAGPDQTVNFVQPVSLDGSGSSDPEGLALSYVWTLDGAQIATGPNPTVDPFPVGARTITLTVTDDQGLSASDSMVVNVINETPVADAGPDQTVQTLETVALDGSASSDPEGETLNYAWSLDGAQIATGPMPAVGPFAAGVHTITLTVTDGHGASATDDAVLTVQNRAPTADAGPDQTINHAQTVMLDASGSADPEGGALSYAWSVDGLQVATGISATVGPFEVGTHSVLLTVTDDHGATATDNMTLTVINEAPVANAGPDQTVGVKGKTTTVTLDGSSSADPEGGPLSYVWTLDGQIVGTDPIAQVDVPIGTHVFTLTVTDDHGATNSDTMVVTAVRGNV